MAISWQIGVFVTCSLLLVGASALVKTKKTEQSSVSYNPTRLTSTSPAKSAEDLAQASSTASMIKLTQSPAQPSIYHSIIDRSASTTPLASSVQATASTIGDLHTAAGHHHGHAHGKYYDYREVPKKKTWKAGYKRGNHKHTIERHEHGKADKKHPHFKAKVKWHDKKSKGKGIHLWDYNHHDKKHGHYG